MQEPRTNPSVAFAALPDVQIHRQGSAGTGAYALTGRRLGGYWREGRPAGHDAGPPRDWRGRCWRRGRGRQIIFLRRPGQGVLLRRFHRPKLVLGTWRAWCALRTIRDVGRLRRPRGGRRARRRQHVGIIPPWGVQIRRARLGAGVRSQYRTNHCKNQEDCANISHNDPRPGVKRRVSPPFRRKGKKLKRSEQWPCDGRACCFFWR